MQGREPVTARDLSVGGENARTRIGQTSQAPLRHECGPQADDTLVPEVQATGQLPSGESTGGTADVSDLPLLQTRVVDHLRDLWAQGGNSRPGLAKAIHMIEELQGQAHRHTELCEEPLVHSLTRRICGYD
jgi:hypothetical protein